jgi:hypothetical protein
MTTKLVSTGVEFPDATIQLTAVPVTTTATSNLGLGTGAVDSITTGGYNVGVGDSALTGYYHRYRSSTASGFVL